VEKKKSEKNKGLGRCSKRGKWGGEEGEGGFAKTVYSSLHLKIIFFPSEKVHFSKVLRE